MGDEGRREGEGEQLMRTMAQNAFATASRGVGFQQIALTRSNCVQTKSGYWVECRGGEMIQVAMEIGYNRRGFHGYLGVIS